MAENSKIEWTHHTFNPWRGCTKVSAGCARCYAETMSKRFPQLGVWGPNGTRVVASESMWREPIKWNAATAHGVCVDCGTPRGGDGDCECGQIGAIGKTTRARVFCASLADVFEGDDTMPADAVVEIRAARLRLLEHIDALANLDWLLLTKRPQNVMPILKSLLDAANRFVEVAPTTYWMIEAWLAGRPPANVWLGTSVENQATANERIPHLIACPAAVRFLSCEPLLEPVNLDEFIGPREFCMECGNATHGRNVDCSECRNSDHTVLIYGEHQEEDDGRPIYLPDIHWVIVGGESGPGARPCDVAWIRSIVDQCKAAGVPCFAKQLGANVRWDGIQGGYLDGTPNTWPEGTRREASAGGFRVLLNDRKGGDMSEWPSDLRVREFPIGGAA